MTENSKKSSKILKKRKQHNFVHKKKLGEDQHQLIIKRLTSVCSTIFNEKRRFYLDLVLCQII